MYKKYEAKSVATDEVLALAFAAYRQNNGYVKTTVRHSEPDKTTVWSNKELVAYTLAIETNKNKHKHSTVFWIPEGFEPVVTTDADIQNIDIARNHVKRYLIGMMSGNLSQFQQEVYEAISGDEIQTTKISLASYIPELLSREVSYTEFKKKIKNDFTDSVAITGPIKSAIEIIDCRYLERYESFSIMAAMDGNLIKFFHKTAIPAGSVINITAKPKKSYIDDKTNCTITYVNYVKIRKK